ncbi:MAG: hypothetical protein LBR72_01900 [Oscillospiraceae bacterium]|jgi:hypothetical protein|nr:hypothetical protein [Oscillospiraceae bacterium]
MTRFGKALPLAALTALICLLFGGCFSFLWEREVYEQTPHLAQQAEEVFISEELQASNESELRETIINAIRNRLTEAEIDIVNYSGQMTREAVSILLSDISNSEPIADFTVRSLWGDLQRVVSSYILTINIRYLTEEQPAIQTASGAMGLRTRITDALLAYQPRLTFEMRYYDTESYDPEEIVRAYYDENPAWSAEMPSLTISLYPSDIEAPHRIADLNFAYQTPPGVLLKKKELTESRAEELLSHLPEFPAEDPGEEPGRREAQLVRWIHDTLCETVVHDEDTYLREVNTGEKEAGDAHTAYGALVGESAVSEGYAMAFKLLCGLLNVECRIVRGQIDGVGHTWNLVRIGEFWYHISAGLDDRGPTPVYAAFLLSDEEAGARRMSGFEGLPSALPGVWSYETIPALGAEEPEEAVFTS